MIKFIRFNEADWGKGFITHDDWKTLNFSVNKSIAQVTGEQDDIDKWADRIKGTEITQAAATKDLLTWEKGGLEAQKIELNAEITKIDVRIGQIGTP
jgi:hypothetical protein